MEDTGECSFCGGRERRPFWRAPMNGLFLWQCITCDLVFVHPLPPPQSLARRYTQEYFNTAAPLEGGYEDYVRDEPITRKTFARRFALLAPHLPATGAPRVLDVGCATGVFLETMRDKGWQGAGLDVSPFARETTRRKGFEVFSGELADLDVDGGGFELITLWDVIEHVSDPGQTLRDCYRLLKPGGCLVLATPDLSSATARLLGRRWMGFRSVGEHVYFFSRPVLGAFLQKIGFEVTLVCSIGKYLSFDRLLTRLLFYTRVFRVLAPFRRFFPERRALYVNPGDTMLLVAKKPDEA